MSSIMVDLESDVPPPGSAGRSRTVSPPHPLLTLSEIPRTGWELMALLASWRYLERLPAGDGHPVLVLPGFASGDAWTLMLRRLLRQLDYDVYRWELGRNTGRQSLRQRLYRRVNEIVGRTGEAFSVVGHSLGGMYARELGQSFPSHVRQVISLGSPFRSQDGEGINDMVHRLYQRTSEEHLPGDVPGNAARKRPRVPTTSVYSRGDGVAAWQLCVEEDSPIAESIEIYGSHSGMTFNPLVLYIVADRLAQPLGAWTRFDVSRLPPVTIEMAMATAQGMLRMGWSSFRNPWRSGL